MLWSKDMWQNFRTALERTWKSTAVVDSQMLTPNLKGCLGVISSRIDVWPCIIYENDERYQLDATIMIYYHKYLYMFRVSICPSSGVQVVCCCIWCSALAVVAVVLMSRCVLHTVHKTTHRPKHVEIFMIINHNCCIKLVPLVIFVLEMSVNPRTAFLNIFTCNCLEPGFAFGIAAK